MAAVAVAGAASAQVTLYGSLDYGYQTSTTETAAGVQTLASSGMVSGGVGNSRWGMKGSEDLGAGLTASFTLEEGITGDTGAATAGFTRAANLSLSGGFGTIGMGVQYLPSFNVIAAADASGTDNQTTSNLLDSRADSTFMYTSPTLGGGFTVKVAMSGDSSEIGVGTATKTQINDYSLGYAAGALSAGVGRYSTQTTTSGTAAAKTSVTSIGAAYDLGIAKLFANKISSTVSGSDTGETNVGVKMPMGASTLYAAWGRNTATSSTSSSDYTLGADYAMSKRTYAYARIAKKQAINAGLITNTTSVGVRHSF